MAAHRPMDGAGRDGEAIGCAVLMAIRGRRVELRTESGRGGDWDDMMCGERELRRAAESEDGELVVAIDEPDGEHAARSIAEE